MLHPIIINIKLRNVAFSLAILSLATIWFAHPFATSGKHTNADPVTVQELSAPYGFAAADPDPDTAFREEDAGISAFLQVSAQSGSGSQARLNINTIADALTSAPDAHSVRQTGTLVDLGLNFGIVEVPMAAATISSPPAERVSVYFDDEGWIVAYLPHDRPAAAIWKYRAADGATSHDPKADKHLEKNLLVLAINEVMLANDPHTGVVTSSDVTYYDWTCPACDALALFTGVSESGTPEEIKFVVPHTISLVRPSAAVVMTEPIDGVDNVKAGMSVDGEVIASATTDRPRNTASFNLRRDVDSTSLHRVVIDDPPDNVAIGAILLLYDRP